MKFAAAVAVLATVASATFQVTESEQTQIQNLSKMMEAGGQSKCVDCASYCSDPSNGNALGAACYIVKCGITVSFLFFRSSLLRRAVCWSTFANVGYSASSVKRLQSAPGWK